MKWIFAIVLAPLFHTPTYRKVGREWGGIGFFFLLTLMIAACIPLFLKVDEHAKKWLSSDEATQALSKIPNVTIKDGVASSTVSQPYVIDDPKGGGKAIFVLDPTGKYKTLDEANAMALLTDKELMFRGNGNQPPQNLPLKDFSNFTFDGPWVKSKLESAQPMILKVALPLVIFVGAIVHLIAAIFLAIVGLFFNFKAKLSFGGLMRVAAVAMTGGTIFSVVTFFTEKNIPHTGLIWLGLMLVYLIVGVIANGRSAGENSPGPQAV